MLDLDSTIKHCEAVIEKKNEELALYHSYKLYEYIPACRKCVKEHEQLAEWLKELKARREKDRPDAPCDDCQEFDCTGCFYKRM